MLKLDACPPPHMIYKDDIHQSLLINLEYKNLINNYHVQLEVHQLQWLRGDFEGLWDLLSGTDSSKCHNHCPVWDDAKYWRKVCKCRGTDICSLRGKYPRLSFV